MKLTPTKPSVCVLEVSPRGPISKQYDKHHLFYVTHDEVVVDTSATDRFYLGFYYHRTWADNRNHLAGMVPRNYDYYMFVDYDVELTSNSALPPMEQIVEDLTVTHAAVLVPTAAKNAQAGECDYKSSLFSNNMVKIVHRSLLDYFFPLPSQFGGFWDCAAFWNILETPLRPHIIRTPFVIARSTVSSAYDQNVNQERGRQAMQAAYEWIKPAFLNQSSMPATVDELKSSMLEEQPAVLVHRDQPNFLRRGRMLQVFDWSHPHFTRSKGRWHERLYPY